MGEPARLSATCQCGKVRLEVAGPPILTAVCHCSDCQEAGLQIGRLASAPAVLDADGGTEIVLVRKDRVRCTAGAEHLREYRLKPESPTRRLVATCCNSAMVLDFTKGHWLSMYRNRFAPDAPAPELRIMTRERRAGLELADDLPNAPGYPGKFMMRLMGAWMAMGFRRPEITWSRAAPSDR